MSSSQPGLSGVPPSYANWRAAAAGVSSVSAYEFPLYTDASNMTGQISAGLGPYQFFNPIGSAGKQGPGAIFEAVAVRVEQHIVYDTPKMERTDPGHYHGGTLDDEIAALASLLIGIRLEAGGVRRRFSPQGDPRGVPIAYDSRPIPLSNVSRTGREAVLPSAITEHSLMVLEKLARYPELEPKTAIALVRAARLYQDALWCVESEPHLAWLLLVSAVETAANHWRSSQDEPLEKLRASKPELLEYLEGLNVEGLPEEVAKAISESLGSTKKFVDFLLVHLPPPPDKRPLPPWDQVPWDEDGLRRVLTKVYGHRSRALHGGIPFPAPMCHAPMYFEFEEWQAHNEVPLGLASYSLGGVWMAEDVPIMLHIFEYIARNALVKWWKSTS